MAIVLLLTLPLQGWSAVLMPFHCLTDEQQTSANAGAQHHGESVARKFDTSTPTTVQHDGGSSATSNEAGNLCCSPVYTGAPSVAMMTTPDTPFVSVDHISIVPPPFFPEQLLRPPRT